MKKLLYIGNKLAGHGLNQTTIETLGPLLEREGFHVTYSSSKKNQYNRIADMLWAVIKNQKADYVIMDTYSTSGFWYAFATSQLCRIFSLKYIPILHGGNLPARLKQNPILCKMIFRHAYRNVAPSHYLLRAFENQGYSNVVYIPNAIEITTYPFKERKQAQARLLWVRSFAKIYNPEMAVLVLKGVKKKYPEAILCMVGPDKDGSLAKTQELATNLGVKVLFTDRLTRQEWTILSQEYDIFINTTHFDNMPVSVVEAMALGLAVVSTNVGGIPFLLNDNQDALLVRDNAPDEMMDAIQKVLENPLLFQEITVAARVRATAFDWEVVKNDWFKIFH